MNKNQLKVHLDKAPQGAQVARTPEGNLGIYVPKPLSMHGWIQWGIVEIPESPGHQFKGAAKQQLETSAADNHPYPEHVI